MRTGPTPTPAPGGLSASDRQAIRAAVAALPPLTDEQIEHLCEVINNLRARHRQHKTGQHTAGQGTAGQGKGRLTHRARDSH